MSNKMNIEVMNYFDKIDEEIENRKIKELKKAIIAYDKVVLENELDETNDWLWSIDNEIMDKMDKKEKEYHKAIMTFYKAEFEIELYESDNFLWQIV